MLRFDDSYAIPFRIEFEVPRNALPAIKAFAADWGTPVPEASRPLDLVYLEEEYGAEPVAHDLRVLARRAHPAAGSRARIDPFDPGLLAIAEPRDPPQIDQSADVAPAAGPPGARALFHRRARRTARRQDLPCHGVITLGLEEGRVADRLRRIPYARLVLEQHGGMPARLAETIATLRAVAPLAIASEDPVEQAMRELMGAAATAKTAERPALRAGMTPEAALGAIIASCLAHWRANQPALIQAGLPEAVHQARVALRRLRAALSLFKGTLPPQREQALKTELRWASSLLGAVRDWDVFLGETLPPVEAAFGHDAFGELRDTAERARAEAFSELARAIGEARWRALPIDLAMLSWGLSATAFSGWPMATVEAFASEIIQRRHAKLLRLGKGFDGLAPDLRHRLRIEVKKLRYTLEFFHDAQPNKRARRLRSRLGALQDALGRDQDRVTSERLLDRVIRRNTSTGEARAAGLVAGWQGALAHRKTREVRSIWQDVASEKPFWRSSAG